MSVYVVAMGYGTNIMDWLKDYGPQAEAATAKHGGKYVVRSMEPEMLEDQDNPPGIVAIFEFPDRASAQAWHNDPEYAPLKELRMAHTTGPVLIVDRLPE